VFKESAACSHRLQTYLSVVKNYGQRWTAVSSPAAQGKVSYKTLLLHLKKSCISKINPINRVHKSCSKIVSKKRPSNLEGLIISQKTIIAQITSYR